MQLSSTRHSFSKERTPQNIHRGMTPPLQSLIRRLNATHRHNLFFSKSTCHSRSRRMAASFIDPPVPRREFLTPLSELLLQVLKWVATVMTGPTAPATTLLLISHLDVGSSGVVIYWNTHDPWTTRILAAVRIPLGHGSRFLGFKSSYLETYQDIPLGHNITYNPTNSRSCGTPLLSTLQHNSKSVPSSSSVRVRR